MITRVQLQPCDEHNQKLESFVHPPDWVNSEPAERYNIVVIGAGPAGLITAIGAAGLGARVALVERELMGDCLNVGCVPSVSCCREENDRQMEVWQGCARRCILTESVVPDR